jgi:hypothetical protein
MNQKNNLPLEKIAKIADDIRLIQNFAENHGFDTGLIQATVTPSLPDISEKWNWPLISLIVFPILLMAVLAMFAFYETMSPKTANFLLVVGLLFVIGASVAAHNKFDNSVITSIVCIGLIAVLLVGAGVFTPREAVDRLQPEMSKKNE